jgi:hypothetical protein
MSFDAQLRVFKLRTQGRHGVSGWQSVVVVHVRSHARVIKGKYESSKRSDYLYLITRSTIL